MHGVKSTIFVVMWHSISPSKEQIFQNSAYLVSVWTCKMECLGNDKVTSSNYACPLFCVFPETVIKRATTGFTLKPSFAAPVGQFGLLLVKWKENFHMSTASPISLSELFCAY